MIPYGIHEPTQGGQAISKKSSNGNPNGLWMKVKWGGILRISDLEETQKYKEDERNECIQRISLYCHVTYLDRGDFELSASIRMRF
ncbi:unnamed protein product [Sphenostylis stenocarpa]|uniref:Uncharacterized protein n=1 Tax=Sphenostylis stenocarpa TaxID=92480 RepID=A0AA86VYC3_9FABA|nr:unnamed protein product [Sphenostylis stenocarpa]